MRKKLVLLLVTVLVALTMVTVLCACNDGNKEEEITILPATTIHVATTEEFIGIKDYLGKEYSNYTFVLDNDIDLSSVENWSSIGDSVNNAFCGTLDGNGKVIENVNFTGWDDNNLPIVEYLGKSVKDENTTAFSTMALFGYVDGAHFKNLTVSGINFKYYADLGYSYTAGLVGYSIGSSSFTDIAVDGNIDFNNTYKKTNTYDNRGERQNSVSSCDSTIYVGGVLAYSTGDTVLKNVSSRVNFNNEHNRAYWHSEANAEPEEIAEGPVEARYIANGFTDDPMVSASQIFVGGIVGVMKSGGIEESDYVGDMSLFAKSVYAGGILAAGYNGELKTSTAQANIRTNAHRKSVVGGIIGLADNFDVTSNTVTALDNISSSYDSTESVSVGGIFGFACNTSEVKSGTVTLLKVSVGYQSASVGGIGGVLRDASLSSSVCSAAEYRVMNIIHSSKYVEMFSTVVNSVYNNAYLSDDNVSVTIPVTSGSSSINIDNVYSKKNSTNYVDEDGKLGIRLFQKGRTDVFVYVFAEVVDGSLKVSVYNEELSLISDATYDREGGFDAGVENKAQEYMDVYYNDGVGFKPATSGEISAGSRDMTEYEYRSGIPTVPSN